MKQIVLVLSLLTTTLPVYGQLNLVLNPSFEDTIGCTITNHEIFLTRYWTPAVDSAWNIDSLPTSTTSPDYEWTPDLELTCNNGNAGGCPDNYFFHRSPRTGNAMVELGLYFNYYSCLDTADPNFYVQMYLQGRLRSPLIAGKNYCVTFYVVMEQSSSFGINKIAAYLDDGSIDTVTGTPRPLTMFTPQVMDTAIIADTVNWVRVQGSFTSNGTERFITIGEFADTATLSKIAFVPTGCYAGYLVDDVSVISSDSSADAGADVTISHAGDTAQIGVSNGAGMPCYWYVLGNNTPIDSGGSTMVHPDSATSYVVEMDLCGHVTRDTVTVHVHTVSVNSVVRQFNSVVVFPNPASQVLNIENAKGCSVVFCDVVGSAVLRDSLVADKEVLDISGLAPGVYFVRVEDGVTGEWVVREVVKE